ncbi:LysM peptidoglycan-binding domain-containing protein [Rhodococcus sp. NPDC049939]|uniref:LysM peptidoglycan-binding domain-containing protein n=1 Tax=Rhodococcus sp. NPDC049939 TaxID=3155511 RepID=UPI0033FA81C3
MSNAVLGRRSVLDRQSVPRSAHVRGARSRAVRTYRTESLRRVGGGDFRRPPSGIVAYRSARVAVSCSDGVREDSEVGWRMVLASIAITAAVFCGLVGVAQLAMADGIGDTVETQIVRVREGESLANVAARVSPGLPAAEVVEYIKELNAMSNSALHPGQRLIVPLSAAP